MAPNLPGEAESWRLRYPLYQDWSGQLRSSRAGPCLLLQPFFSQLSAGDPARMPGGAENLEFLEIQHDQRKKLEKGKTYRSLQSYVYGPSPLSSLRDGMPPSDFCSLLRLQSIYSGTGKDDLSVCACAQRADGLSLAGKND